MAGDATAVRIPLQLLRGCIVASIQLELSPTVLDRLQRDLLDLVHRSGAGTVVLDLAGLDVIDPADFEGLKRALSMARIMGARSIIAGMQPGAVSALIDLGVDLDGLRAALDLDDAFRILDVECAGDTTAEETTEGPSDSHSEGDDEPAHDTDPHHD